jgi:hypothetical protein
MRAARLIEASIDVPALDRCPALYADAAGAPGELRVFGAGPVLGGRAGAPTEAAEGDGGRIFPVRFFHNGPILHSPLDGVARTWDLVELEEGARC